MSYMKQKAEELGYFDDDGDYQEPEVDGLDEYVHKMAEPTCITNDNY